MTEKNSVMPCVTLLLCLSPIFLAKYTEMRGDLTFAQYSTLSEWIVLMFLTSKGQCCLITFKC